MFSEVSKNETFVAQLFDNHPDAVLWLVPVFDSRQNLIIDFQFRYCNAALDVTTGVDPNLLKTRTLLSTPALGEVSQLFEKCLHVWNTGEPLQFTYQNAGKQFNAYQTRVLNGILHMIRDRTSEIKTEQQAGWYNDVLNKSASAIVVAKSVRDANNQIIDLQIVLANEAGRKVANITDDDIGKKVSDLMPALFSSGHFSKHKHVIETGVPHVETICFSRDDKQVWFKRHLSKLGDAVISNFTDVTEIKEKEKTIEGQAKLLTLMLNSSLNGVYILDGVTNSQGEVTDFIMSHVNQVFCSMSGRKKEDLIGKSYTATFPDTVNSGVFARNCRVLKTGIPVREELHYKGDGVDRWYDTCVNKVTDNQIVIAFNDITALKQTTVKLQRTVHDLEKSNEQLSDYTRIASHDLSEPLRKIMTFSSMIQEECGDELSAGLKAYMTKIQATATRMQALIDDLLTYSQITNTEKLFEKVPLNQIVTDVQIDLERLIQEKNAKIIVGQLPEIYGDKIQLTQIFQNLISNAIKFQKDNDAPLIQIQEEEPRTKNGRDYYCISVKDNGIGFDPKYSQKIFDVFYRLHNRSEYEGTGIGLAIVRQAMENQSGLIEVESTPGQGSCFYLLFTKDSSPT